MANFKAKDGYENIDGHNVASFGAPRPSQVNTGLDSHPGATRGITNDLVAQGNANIRKRRAGGQQGINLGLANAQVSNNTAPITQSRINGVQSFSNIKPAGQADITQTSDVPTQAEVAAGFNGINQRVADTMAANEAARTQQQIQLPGQADSIHQSQPGSGINAEDLSTGQQITNNAKINRGRLGVGLQNAGRSIFDFFNSAPMEQRNLFK